MLPLTQRMISLPARDMAIRSALRRLVVLHPVADLPLGDLLQGAARPLVVLPRLHLVLRPAVELPRPLGREHDEQVAVGHLFEGLLERGERHHSGTSTSGSLRVSRLVRHRSAWMMVASWSTASFTSRLMIR